jgi:hypothetical protein
MPKHQANGKDSIETLRTEIREREEEGEGEEGEEKVNLTRATTESGI